jgi:hypothetical protein
MHLRCWTLGLLALPLLGGCLKVKVCVQMHEDGGATITETIEFSGALMELNGSAPTTPGLPQMLTRNAAAERVKEMGEGATLASHKQERLPDGGLRSIAVYRIGDVEDLRLVNPYLHQGRPGRRMRLRFEPIYKRVHSFHKVGDLMLYVVPVERPRRGPAPQEPPPPEPTPLQLQLLRALQPMFADMMEGFEIELALIASKPVSLGYIRDHRAASKRITLLSMSGRDLDAHGGRFLENEELMLSLLRLRFDADNLSEHAQGFAANKTLPVFRGKKPYAVGRFRIEPTRALFKKYFAGRPKSQGGDVEDDAN